MPPSVQIWCVASVSVQGFDDGLRGVSINMVEFPDAERLEEALEEGPEETIRVMGETGAATANIESFVRVAAICKTIHDVNVFELMREHPETTSEYFAVTDTELRKLSESIERAADSESVIE